MTREYQVIFHKDGGEPQSCAIVGSTASALRTQLAESGYQVIAINFARFISDGLSDDGLGIEDIQLHVGCDRNKAVRLAREAGYVKRGRVICVPLLQWDKYMAQNRVEGMAA